MTNSGITPPSPSPPKPSGGNNGQVVKIVSLPEGLQNVSRAVRLEGEVVGQNKDGTTRIKTSEGDIDVSIRGRQPQPGSQIEVDIPPGSPPRQATVRSVTPPQTPQTPTTQEPSPEATTQPVPVITRPAQGPITTNETNTTQAQQAQTPSPQPTTEGTTKPALPTSYQPTAQGTIPTQPATQLPPLSPEQIIRLVPVADNDGIPTSQITAPVTKNPATTIVGKVADQANLITQKSQTGLIGNLIQAVKSVLPSINASTQIAPTSQAPSAPTLIQTPNTPITLFAKVIGITSPSGQTVYTGQTTTPTEQSPTITAQPIKNTALPFTAPITGITPKNMPIVAIPMNPNGATQNFVIQASAKNIMPGTQITLLPQLTSAPTIINNAGTVVTPTQAASSLPTAWRTLLPLMEPASLWPAIDEIFQTFYQTTPQAAQILGRIIPSPANAGNFGPAIMLFAASMRAGDLQGWIGEKKLEMIQKLGKESLLSRLSTETSSLTQDADGPSTEWRSYPIPLLWQNEISKVMFHARQESDGQNQENKEGGTRFLLDLSLPRMGDVQLDGYLAGKRLDIIIRTQNAISVPMQEAMKTAYADALDGTEIYGEIAFQGDLKNWVHVLKREENLGVSA